MENNNFIVEDYVNFETAKLLKEKGFNWPCLNRYVMGVFVENKHLEVQGYYINSKIKEEEVISAPTLQMAIKFIREKYNYHIIATPEYGDVEYMPGQWQEEFLGWKYSIIPIERNESIMHPTVYAKTPESACEEGVKFMLNRKI